MHFIGIQYNDTNNKPAGILLQGDKDNYRAILVALQGVSRVRVAVAEKDREFLPVGVTSDVVKNSEEAEAGQGAESSKGGDSGTVNVASIPDGADVLVERVPQSQKGGSQ